MGGYTITTAQLLRLRAHFLAGGGMNEDADSECVQQ